MGLYRVRDGHELGHCGKTLLGGAIVELPDNLAKEVSGRVKPCTDEGLVWDELSAEEREVLQAPPVLRVEIRQRHVEAAREALQRAEAALANERVKANEPPPKPVVHRHEPPPPLPVVSLRSKRRVHPAVAEVANK